MALAGESAGGNLAVATAVAARDARLPMPVHVVSVYPIAQTRLDTPSYLQHQNARPLDRPMMNWFFWHTIRRNSGLREEARALVVGIERAGQRLLNPDGTTTLAKGDVLWVAGDRERIKAFMSGGWGEAV